MAKITLPKSFQKENSQEIKIWYGKNNSVVLVLYDDRASRVSSTNQYAVFTKKGFHGWMDLGFTQSELMFMANREPEESYEVALEDFVKSAHS